MSNILNLVTNIDSLIVVTLILSLIAIILSVQTNLKIKNIFRNANVKNLEQLISLHSKTLEDLKKFELDLKEYTLSLNKRMLTKVDKISTIRFNPFEGQGVGGNQSFSTIFADEKGDGLVITSMHTRERTNVFAKPIKNWQSTYELSEEEIAVIKQSKNQK